GCCLYHACETQGETHGRGCHVVNRPSRSQHYRPACARRSRCAHSGDPSTCQPVWLYRYRRRAALLKGAVDEHTVEIWCREGLKVPSETRSRAAVVAQKTGHA